jgi:hypothetical protein
MTTITTSTTVGIDLNPALYTSPVVIGAGVTISNPNYPYAVYRHPGAEADFTIQNEGTITGGSAGIGVYLAPGGSINNAASGLISGEFGVKISAGAGTVVNDGSIIGDPHDYPFGLGIGVGLYAGGLVKNEASALIAGYRGVRIWGAGMIVNDGSIAGSRTGVGLYAGGSVTNGAGASISAEFGVLIAGGSGTVINDGTIAIEPLTTNRSADLYAGGLVTNAANAIMGSIFISGGVGTVITDGSITSARDGIDLGGGARDGLINNAASASITALAIGVSMGGGTLTNDGYIAGGIFGAYVFAGATLINAGMIIGNSGTAMVFGGSVGYSDRLVLDPGFVFSGIVMGSTSAGNTIELAQGAGTLTGLGTQYLHFGSIVFDPGAQWSIGGIMRGLAGTISGFQIGDTIDLGGFVAVSDTFASNSLVLTDAGDRQATLNIVGNFTTGDFILTNDGSAGTFVSVDRTGPAPRDFEGNGTSDILWRDAAGDVAIWDMNGALDKGNCSGASAFNAVSTLFGGREWSERAMTTKRGPQYSGHLHRRPTTLICATICSRAPTTTMSLPNFPSVRRGPEITIWLSVTRCGGNLRLWSL